MPAEDLPADAPRLALKDVHLDRWVASRLEFALAGGLTLDAYEAIVAASMRARGDPPRLQLLLEPKEWSGKPRRRLLGSSSRWHTARTT